MAYRKEVPAIQIEAILKFVPNTIRRIQALAQYRREGYVIIAALGDTDINEIKAENPKIPFVLND